jgi:hypothetical protein
MDDALGLKTTNDFDDGIHLTDVREKLIPQPLASMRPANQSGNVEVFNRRRDSRGGFVNLREHLQPVVRNGDDPDIAINRAEGIVGHLGLV